MKEIKVKQIKVFNSFDLLSLEHTINSWIMEKTIDGSIEVICTKLSSSYNGGGGAYFSVMVEYWKKVKVEDE